ncbi:hypothetical protein [Paenibacillus rigui]|uniref:Uncharacterized protein n=1 Tax=Paenibacillus rigui TaxID=554312 RepID=A0A229UH62_9BACL|nr:hypothetical protein [Paenibacillus rigui]OXM82724.1 hypothetical protein CF651_29065 [Paenibacillus rigui]
MEIGHYLVGDHDFEEAKKMGYIIKATQGHITIYPPGKITAYSDDHVAIEGKRLFRPVNRFEIVGM